MLLIAVVGLIGESKTGLTEVDKVAAGVLGVGVNVETHTAAHTGALQSSHHPRQGIPVLG